MNEIKINKPGWKKFTLTKHNDYVGFDTISVTIKHPELKLWYFGYWERDKDYVIWPYDDDTWFDRSKLVDLLNKYNLPYKEVNGDDPYIKIPLSLIDMEGTMNEIKIENPNPIEKQIYFKILPMYPEAEISPAGLKNSYVIFLFPDSKPKVMNRNTIIIYSSLGQFSVMLGDDINGRIFKHMDSMLKYIYANPVEKPMNEIKVNAPQPFMFEIVDNRYDDFKFGKIYFNGKLLDDKAVYSVSPVNVNENRPHIVFGLDSVKYKNLRDILKSNNARVLNQNGKIYNMVIDNIDNVKIVNPSEPMNEIRVNKPGKPFKFVETRKDWGELYYEGQLIDNNTFIVLSYEDNSQDFTPIGISVYKTDVINYDLHNYVIDYPLEKDLFDEDSKITAIDAKYVDINSEIEEIKVLTPMDKKRPYIDNRYVDLKSIELEDVFQYDYPDFVDAYISYAEFEDGAELTPEQIEYIQEEWPELVGEIATGDYLSYGNMREIKINNPNWKNFEAEMVDQEGDLEIFKFTHPEGNIAWYGHKEQGSDIFNIEFGDNNEVAVEERFAKELTDLLSKYNKSYKRVDFDRDVIFWIQIPASIVNIADEIEEIKINNPTLKYKVGQKLVITTGYKAGTFIYIIGEPQVYDSIVLGKGKVKGYSYPISYSPDGKIKEWASEIDLDRNAKVATNEIKVESPITKIPIKFNRYLTAFTDTVPSGKLYDVIHSGFPESNIRIYKNEPDIAYLSHGNVFDVGSLKTTLDRLDIPYERMISSFIIPIKYVYETN